MQFTSFNRFALTLRLLSESFYFSTLKRQLLPLQFQLFPLLKIAQGQPKQSEWRSYTSKKVSNRVWLKISKIGPSDPHIQASATKPKSG